jgi:hypothetical protein
MAPLTGQGCDWWDQSHPAVHVLTAARHGERLQSPMTWWICRPIMPVGVESGWPDLPRSGLRIAAEHLLLSGLCFGAVPDPVSLCERALADGQPRSLDLPAWVG